MKATCKWAVTTMHVDSGMMFDAIRKLIKPDKHERWHQEAVERMSRVDDDDPDSPCNCYASKHQLPHKALDILENALAEKKEGG